MRRPLSALETFVWAGGKLPRNFALAAEVDGPLALDTLAAAVQQVNTLHPPIRGRIVIQSGQPWYTDENVPEIPIIESTADWHQMVADELVRPFDTQRGPLVRIALIHGSSSDWIALICHHCIADGVSAAHILCELIKALSGHPLSHPDIQQTQCLDDLIPPAIHSDKIGFHWPPLPAITFKPKVQLTDPIFILTYSLTGQQTGALVAACRRERVSVHAAFCAAFLTTNHLLADAGFKATGRISSPVSLRNRLCQPVGTTFGLFIHPGVKTVLPNDGQSGDFWEIARLLKHDIDDEITRPGFWGLLRMARQTLKVLPLPLAIRMSEMQVDYDLSLTNLGVIDFPSYENGLRIHAVYGPLVNSMAGEKVAGVLTAIGQLSLSFVSRGQIIPHSLAVDWCNAVLQTLSQLAQTGSAAEIEESQTAGK
jgi:hypothetical protein